MSPEALSALQNAMEDPTQWKRGELPMPSGAMSGILGRLGPLASRFLGPAAKVAPKAVQGLEEAALPVTKAVGHGGDLMDDYLKSVSGPAREFEMGGVRYSPDAIGSHKAVLAGLEEAAPAVTGQGYQVPGSFFNAGQASTAAKIMPDPAEQAFLRILARGGR